MKSFDLVVIGAGPGGYVAAIRARQLGMKVAIVERDRLGGVCLNWGCIPTKALLKIAEHYEFLQHASDWGFEIDGGTKIRWDSVIKRSRAAAEKLSRGVQHLMKKNKIEVVSGAARFMTPGRIEAVDASGATTELSASSVIIATGARPATLPGVAPDGKRIITSKEAMILPDIPRSMTVIGAGAIGLEFAYFYRVFGTEITIVEYLDRLLPGADEEISTALARSFRKRGIQSHVGSKVQSVTATGVGTQTLFEKDGDSQTVDADVTLVAVGVQGNTEGLGLDGIGVEYDRRRGIILVNEHCRTSVHGVYAIGDVCGPPALAHAASAEGIHAVEHIAGRDLAPIDYTTVPACIYCQPQVASVGMTETEAREKGHDVNVGRFPFSANGKSVAVGEVEGFVKIVGDAESGEVLGAHIIGPEATELIAELALARASELTVHDLHHTIHSHPTLSESVMEAAAEWGDEALHI